MSRVFGKALVVELTAVPSKDKKLNSTAHARIQLVVRSTNIMR
jgi:hypothetical protein